MLLGNTLMLPVTEGKLAIGAWLISCNHVRVMST